MESEKDRGGQEIVIPPITPEEAPPPTVNVAGSSSLKGELTEEDLFKMKGLAVKSDAMGDQSLVSLADSASNFDEHVPDDYSEVDANEETGENSDQGTQQNRILGGFAFSRNRRTNPDIPRETVTVLNYSLPAPPMPEGEDEKAWKAAFADAKVYLVGTAHFSKQSQEDVLRTIALVQPDLVMVELCPSRISILSMDEQSLLKEAKELNTEKILATIRQSGVVQGILHVLLLSMSAHITRELSMAPGGEFRAAHKGVLQVEQCRLILGDRPIHVTLQRALSSLSFWQKIKFFYHIVLSHNASITPEDVEKCKQMDLLEQLLQEMAGDFPLLTKIFVEERDLYMVHALHSLIARTTAEKRAVWTRTDAAWEPLNVVAVVGIGHVPGIVANWNESVDIGPLLVIPPPSLTSKLVSFSFRTIFYGALFYGVYRIGRGVYAKIR